jgi:hypothetical protein
MLSALLAFSLSAAPASFEWNVPELISWTQVGSNGMEAAGLPLKMYAVRSKWKLHDLAVHYAKRFIDTGFYVDPRQKFFPGSSLPRLTALDPQTMWSYTVVFYEEKDGTTTMLLGAADLGHRRPASETTLPLFPGGEHPSSFNLETAHALAFTAAATDVEVIAFYRQTLTAAGFTESAPGVFAKAGRQLRVFSKPEGSKLGVVVLDEPSQR